ncbi:MAG: DUF4115 domain-containing protein [Synergistaceae bacterium]|jgi:cytoskeletal protein RodZ|nr:DUF4115 domain-containing protein [Synergistaceae bacterium]
MPSSSREERLKELGRMAMERRESANISLDDIYDKTRLRLEYLRGIEHGNYKGFPDLVYIRGFVRTYLNVIGADDLKADFLEQLGRERDPVPEAPPAAILSDGASKAAKGFKPASHFQLFAVLFLALVGAVCYVWYSVENGQMSWQQTDPIASVRAKEREPRNGAEAREPSRNGAALPAASDASAPGEASLDSSTMSIIPPSALPKPAETPKPHLRVEAVRDDVWMRVYIGDERVFDRTLKMGSAVSWDLTARARVTYGRPGAPDVSLNGKNLGAPNPSAKVSEGYFYDPDGTYGRQEKPKGQE